MKLSGSAAARFCRDPDPAVKGMLLHGPDAGLIGLRRQDLVRAVAEGDDLRVARLGPGDLKSDPACLDSELRAQGFFPGRRIVVIEDAKDAVSGQVSEAIDAFGAADAFLLVTAVSLTAKSSLRKLFEGHSDLISAGLYPDAPDAADILRSLVAAGANVGLEPEAEGFLVGLGASMDPGSFHQTLEKIAVFSLNHSVPLSLEDIVPQCPLSTDAELDELIAAVAGGRPDLVGPVLQRVQSGGSSDTQILGAMSRHFRQLISVISSGDGIEAAIGRLRPPAFGPRRQALSNQSRLWGVRIDDAAKLIFETERTLRSPGTKPDGAIVERCLLRLAMMASQRR